VRLRALFADELPDLKLTQTLDDQRPDNLSREQRRQAGEGGAKG
jgi:hypothetical protein